MGAAFLSAVVLGSGVGYGAPVSLAWDASPEPEVAGYRLHIGTQAGVYATSVDVGARTEWTLTALQEGTTYYFTVQAYTASGAVSPVSNTVVHTVTHDTSVRGDLDGDGLPDILVQDRRNGSLALWHYRNGSMIDGLPLTPHARPDLDWMIVGEADFNADGHRDILWRHMRTGQLEAWLLRSGVRIETRALQTDRVADPVWRIAAVVDLDGDGMADILWHHTTQGWLAAWKLDGTSFVRVIPLSPSRVDPECEVAAVADFDGDGWADILWRDRKLGWLAFWRLRDGRVLGGLPLTPGANRVADLNWRVVAAVDLDGDANPDLLWQHPGYGLAVWRLRRGELLGAFTLPPPVADPGLQIVGPR